MQHSPVWRQLHIYAQVRAVRRLLLYVTCLLVTLAAFESLLRWQHTLFLGASHRAAFKASVYNLRGGTDFAFYGSSRTEDGIWPPLAGPGVFVLAIPSTSIETLEWIVAHAPPPKRLAIVEVSIPQNESKRPPWLPPQAGGDLESRLQAEFAARSDLLGLRRAFRFDALWRLAATAFAPQFDGSEVTGMDFIKAISKRRPHRQATLTPLIERRITAPSDATHPLTEHYAAVAHALKHVVFYVPPTRTHEVVEPLLGALANVAPVWDLSQNQLPAEWFRDDEHLNAQGAAEMSAAFAGWLNAIQ